MYMYITYQTSIVFKWDIISICSKMQNNNSLFIIYLQFIFGWAKNSNVRMLSSINCMISYYFFISLRLLFGLLFLRWRKKKQIHFMSERVGVWKEEATFMPNKHTFFTVTWIWHVWHHRIIHRIFFLLWVILWIECKHHYALWIHT